MTTLYIVKGRNSCPYCIETKKYLRQNKLKYRFYNEDTSRYNSKIPESYTTVPKIIHVKNKNYHFVGGYSDLLKYSNQKIYKKTKTNKKKYNL